MFNRPSPIALAFILIAFSPLLSRSGSNYRVDAIIKTNKPYAITWHEGGLFGRKHEYINPYTYNPAAASRDRKDRNMLTPNSKLLYKIATVMTQEDKELKRQTPNELQNAIVRVSKNMTVTHLARLKAMENNVNLLLGGATAALSGGASVAVEATAKSLSATAAGTGGARAMFNEQVYRKVLGESLIRAIETDQFEFLEMVINKRQLQLISKYDVEAAIRDAVEYQNRGSFFHGLPLVGEAVEKENVARKEKADNEITRRLFDEAKELVKLKITIRLLFQNNNKNLAAKQWIGNHFPNDPNKDDPDRFIDGPHGVKEILKALRDHLTNANP